MNPEELLALLGWIPQHDWQRETVSRIVRDLAASSDAAETRRWFRRPQESLGRRTPLEALRLAKRPDDPLLEQLRRLARSPNG
jgi:Protein of unknown function (DUF2384)